MVKAKYDSLVTAALGGTEAAKAAGLKSDTVAELFRMAWELDALKVRLEADATDMANRFGRYAAEVEEGRIYDPPTGWSTLREMDKNATKYQTIRDAFQNFFRPVTGKSLRVVREELELVDENAPLADSFRKVS